MIQNMSTKQPMAGTKPRNGELQNLSPDLNPIKMMSDLKCSVHARNHSEISLLKESCTKE